MILYFVTPAWQRFALSAVCFDQRLEVIAALAKRGIEAHCVVIADDENLELARARGFDTVERDNEWLGRKFNDGIEYAGTHGADWIVPIGSDSWIDPAYFVRIPRRAARTSRKYAVVTADRIAELTVERGGAGPYILPAAALRRSGFRPSDDQLKRGVDGSTLQGLGPVTWTYRDLHPLQYIGFRGTPHLTTYDRLWQHWGVFESDDPWNQLAEHYSPALVDAARKALVQ
jgi:hypothetical protein